MELLGAPGHTTINKKLLGTILLADIPYLRGIEPRPSTRSTRRGSSARALERAVMRRAGWSGRGGGIRTSNG